ncbi:MAG: hypothetical protein ABIJ09_01905, partial [Pseudomonadota bacterium]
MSRIERGLGSLMLAAACLVLVGGECPGGSDRPDFDGGLDGGGRDVSVVQVKLYDWNISRGFTSESPSPVAPLATAVGPGGRIAVGYYKAPDPVVPYHCVTNLGESDIEDIDLKLARFDGAAWTTDLVETVHSPDAYATLYDAAGGLQMVYMAGPTTGTYCGVSQLFGRYINGAGLGSPTTLVANSATGDACRLMQNACNAGDNAGRFPSLELLPDGRMLLAYQDTHFNFGQQTDIEGSDLEVIVGTAPLAAGGRACLDDSSGAGAFLDTFVGMGGRPAVAYWVPVTHNFNSTGCLDNPPVAEGTSYNWKRGMYVAQLRDDDTWDNLYIADIIVNQRLAAAYTESDGYMVAYRLGSSLAAYFSADGVTWQSRNIDSAGRNGVSPSALVDGQGRILIAYGKCSNSPGASCAPAQDAVRIAVLSGGQWKTEDVVNDSDELDGTEVHLHLDPDSGNPVVVYRAAASQQVMIARGTPHTN